MMEPRLNEVELCPCCSADAASLHLSTKAQEPTVGVLFQSEASYDGYTLMPVTASSNTYLLNNCGEVVNTWVSQYKAGMMAYLLPDGGLMRAGKTNNQVFGAGGAGGIIEQFDWEGNLLWSYLISSPTQCQHHDIAVLPNGNILALVWQAYPAEEWIARGRNPEMTPDDVVWGTCIMEIEPQGSPKRRCRVEMGSHQSPGSKLRSRATQLRRAQRFSETVRRELPSYSQRPRLVAHQLHRLQ